MIEVEEFVDKIVGNPNLLFDLVNTEYASPLSIIDLAELPDLPGIYVVAASKEMPLSQLNQIVYIGVATKSIRARWGNHHKMPIFKLLEQVAQNCNADKYECPYLGIFCWVNPFTSADFLLALERALINRLQPPCNNLQVGKNKDSYLEELFLKFLKGSNIKNLALPSTS